MSAACRKESMDEVGYSEAVWPSALLALVLSGWAQTIRLRSIDAYPEILLRDNSPYGPGLGE
ncbi:hypothetical protein F1880_005954 [Penicillium rolfsii]|nr:hypothetical protein F1880_005954 [Penicillium rolfsii]